MITNEPKEKKYPKGTFNGGPLSEFIGQKLCWVHLGVATGLDRANINPRRVLIGGQIKFRQDCQQVIKNLSLDVLKILPTFICLNHVIGGKFHTGELTKQGVFIKIFKKKTQVDLPAFSI